MILHELATNAAKYGAISASKGKVEIDWSVADQRLHLTWRESDGPAVSEPTRTGLGMRLIEREAASGLDGDINMAFQPSGLRVELTMRLDMASVPPKAFAPA
jgi:two-component sensor histidine kinase